MNIKQIKILSYLTNASNIYAEWCQKDPEMYDRSCGIEVDKIIVEIAKMLQNEENNK